MSNEKEIITAQANSFATTQVDRIGDREKKRTGMCTACDLSARGPSMHSLKRMCTDQKETAKIFFFGE